MFNRHEPSTKYFVLIAFGVGYLGPLIFCIAWQSDRFASLTTATSSLAVYLTTLATSTIAYRLSPWHPLACFPGPVLASTTKWWGVHLFYSVEGGTKFFKSESLRFWAGLFLTCETAVCIRSMGHGCAAVDELGRNTSLNAAYVWVGPNELSINLPTAVHPIYLHLSRAEFYKGLLSLGGVVLRVDIQLCCRDSNFCGYTHYYYWP